MKKSHGFTLLGLLLSVGAANALPIFSHTTDASGLLSITVDATNEPTNMMGLDINNVLGLNVIGDDIVTDYPALGYTTIADENMDDLIQFSITAPSVDSVYNGTVYYSNEFYENFAYEYTVPTFQPDPAPAPAPVLPSPTSRPPSSNVPEPSTFLLLGAGLIGMAGTRLKKKRQ